jgi:LacI family purine nucleotide synthesis repressor
MAKITIKEVAKAANVSISTVSKVMNDAPTISDATKLRVKKIMEEMNYYPNVIARSFVQQSSKNIGVVMDLKRHYAFLNSHLYEILGGIEAILSDNDYTLTLLNSSSLKDGIDPYEKIILEKRVDGLIIHISNLNKTLCKKMDSMNFPYVVIGQPNFDFNVCWIDINNKLAGEIAGNHLIDEGYKKIAFVGGVTSKDNVSLNRQNGVLSALKQKGLTIHEEYIKEGDTSCEHSETMMRELLDLDTPPDSVICLNNYVAFGVIGAIKKARLNIPNDIAVISFDNYPLSMYTEPPLSVVDNDVFELGSHAANILLNKIANPNLQMQYSMLSPNLIIRESSKRK